MKMNGLGALLVVSAYLWGCDTNVIEEDAPAADGGSDAGPAEVAVVVLTDGVPTEGALVVFHSDDGLVAGTEPTDAEGRASHAVLSPSAMITIVWGAGATRALETHTGILPGETLRADRATEPEVTTRNVVVEVGTLPPLTTSVELVGSCGGTVVEASETSALLEICAGRSINLIGYALDDTGARLAFSPLLDQPADSTRLVLPAFRTDFLSLSYAVTNAPFPLQFLVSAAPNAAVGLASTSEAMGTLELVPLDAPHTIAVIGTRTTATGSDSVAIARGFAVLPATFTLDVLAEALPAIEITRADGLADAARPTLAWTLAGTATADTMVISVGGWVIYLPPTATELTWPALPAFLADAAPAPAAMVSLQLRDASTIDGWEALRLGNSDSDVPVEFSSRSRRARVRISAEDADMDGVPDALDACPSDPDDAFGNPCNHDEDGDGVLDIDDACPEDPNDAVGNPCNHDEDGDGIEDGPDACPLDPNDAFGDPCDHDDDDDGILDSADACPLDPNDAIGDPCNHDEDDDGVLDPDDPCPTVAGAVC